MNHEETLNLRSNSSCELCKANSDLAAYQVPPVDATDSEKSVLLCSTCLNQVIGTEKMNINHWHCLNDSMWSQVPVVQIMAWRLLKRLSTEVWAQDLLEMLYLDEEMLAWAESDLDSNSDSDEASDIPTKDCNGAILQAGDTVTLIKDLDVKGAGFTAKRGTAVRNISLTTNPEHIEGRVNGTRIVLLTCYLKKS